MTISYQRDVASSTAGGFTRILFKWKEETLSPSSKTCEFSARLSFYGCNNRFIHILELDKLESHFKR